MRSWGANYNVFTYFVWVTPAPTFVLIVVVSKVIVFLPYIQVDFLICVQFLHAPKIREANFINFTLLHFLLVLSRWRFRRSWPNHGRFGNLMGLWDLDKCDVNAVRFWMNLLEQFQLHQVADLLRVPNSWRWEQINEGPGFQCVSLYG